MDRLAAMQTFVRVAEAGSFTAVAARMNLARSAVTRQIAALEAHLGVKLIARSTRKLALTSAGVAYVEQCREILDRIDEAEGGLAAEGGTLRGALRVSVPMSLGVSHLAPLILDFCQAHPDVRVDVDFNDRHVNLIEEGIDVALRITERLPETTVARRLAACRLVVAAAPAYLARHGEPAHPAELARHDCLAYSLSSRSNWTFMVDGRPQGFDIAGRFCANNGNALCEAAERGMGILYTPTFVAGDALRAGRLVPILRGFTPPVLEMFAVYPGNRFVPRRVHAFVDFLAGRLGPEPAWDRGLSAD